MKVVLDTNVLVSGLLTPFGTCGEIVRMLTSGALSLCVDARILLEYDAVLRRPRFDIDPRMIDILMAYVESSAQVCATVPLVESLDDPDDDAFVEVALAAEADCIVTGNTRHFPAKLRCGSRVLSPRQFLDFYRATVRKA